MTELSVSVRLEHREDGPRTVVRLAGEADVTTPALAQVLGAEAAKKPRLLLIDVSELAFLDSSALHEIVRVHRELRADGCLLALIGPTPAVTRILQLSGLDQVIRVHASAQEVDTQLPSLRPVDPPAPRGPQRRTAWRKRGSRRRGLPGDRAGTGTIGMSYDFHDGRG